MMRGITDYCFYTFVAEPISLMSGTVDSFCCYLRNPSRTRDGAHILGCATLAHPISLRLVWCKPHPISLFDGTRYVFSRALLETWTFLNASSRREERTCH